MILNSKNEENNQSIIKRLVGVENPMLNEVVFATFDKIIDIVPYMRSENQKQFYS